MLILIRGLSGSGKTTLAKLISDTDYGIGADIFAADDHFMVDGQYQFDPAKLPEAHAECRGNVDASLSRDRWVVVHNTFSCRWELEPYLRLAGAHAVKVHVIDLFDGGCSDVDLVDRTEHGVPLSTIQAMRARWEHDWRSGDPLPPWERSDSVEGAQSPQSPDRNAALVLLAQQIIACVARQGEIGFLVDDAEAALSHYRGGNP